MRRTKNTYQYRGHIIRKHLLPGSMQRVALITGYSYQYVIDVLTAKRYNETILREALKIAKEDRRLKRIARLRNELQTQNKNQEL